MASLVELYQTFNKLISILHKPFQKKTVKKGILLHSFYEASISLIPKPDRYIAIKKRKKKTTKYYRSTSLNIEAKILKKTNKNKLANQVQ